MMDDVSICLSLSLYLFSDIVQILQTLPKVFLFPESFHALFNLSVIPSYINTYPAISFLTPVFLCYFLILFKVFAYVTFTTHH
jgi:hypothetical protein